MKVIALFRLSPCLLFLATLCAPVFATIYSLPSELACASLPDPSLFVASASAVTTSRYPNANTVLIDYLGCVAYQPDGTSVAICSEYTKVLTEKGRQDNSIRSFPYMADYGTVAVVRAEIIKPDASCVTIDPASNSCVMIDNSQMGANIYDKQMKILQISIPGLEVGDLLCLVVQITAFKAYVPDTWFDMTPFESVYPICHAVYEVIAPESRPLRHMPLRSAISNTVTYSSQPLPGSRTMHRWVARDVPQLFQEPQMPEIGSVAQRVLVSTASDWPAISRWYWHLCQPRLDTVTSEMRETVSNLVAGVADRDVRINRIFTFVSQKIRYMGITTEDVAPGFEPHDVSLTFSNRYGVCRDKAALLVAMLRLADIEAYPVLIMVGAKLDPDVPTPNFNHAIVAVTRHGGGYILMDPTNENTRDLCPAYLGNRSYLVAHPRGESLRVSEVVPADHNMMRITSNGTLDESGTLMLDIRLAFDGINDNSYRSWFVQQKPDERRRYFEELLKGRFSGSELIAFSLEPGDLQDTQVPLVARLSCRVPHYPVPGEGVTLVAVPWLAEAVGTVNTLLAGATLKQRKYPFVTDFACGVDETVSIAINRHIGDPLDLPPVTRFHRPGVDSEMTISITNDVLNGHFHFELQQPEYSPVEYADLKKSCRDIEYASRQRAQFIATDREQADMRVLSNDLRIKIDDSHTWTRTRTVKFEVLTYAGIKSCAEAKLPFNPAWMTVELISSTVSNRDGTVHVVGPTEVNLMDAEWVGGAQRYPDGKVLVASRPGVEVGSVIQSTSRTIQHDAPFFYIEHNFACFDPLQVMSLEIDSSLDLKLRMDARFADSLHAVCVTNGGRVVHRWTFDPQHGVAREENMPPWHEFMPTILVSAGDWAEYGRGVGRAFEAAMYGQTGACEQARALVKDLRDVDARLTVIRDYVARAIREAGPGFQDLPLSCLTPADTTLRDGYGNMPDRAILLATMLRAIGFDAEIILASKSPILAPGMLDPLHAIPQLSLYDAVLVGVKHRGATVYLNDSDQYGVLGATMYNHYPLMHLSGETGRVSVADAYRDRSREEYTVNLETNGCATITVTNWFYGATCGSFRKQQDEMPPEERDRYFQGLVANISQSSVPVGGFTTDTHGYPGYSAFTVRADRYAVREGRTLTLLLPHADSPALTLSGDERENPLYVANPSDSEWVCRVILPPGVRDVPVTPAALALTLPEGLGRVSFDVIRSELADGRLCMTFRRVSRIESAILPATLYPALLEINRRLTHPSVSTVMAVME